MSRRESVGRFNARTQSASGPPVRDNVTVAVLSPSLPSGLAARTGVGMADCFNWDESLNWQQAAPEEQEAESGRRKSLFKKAGFTTERQRRNPDNPPYTFKVVPYDVWRRHYAKDKDGNYRGTHAPAEDCLLKPDDVRKWNIGETNSPVDKWTRGKEVLPVYAEVQESGMVPEYEVDYTGPPREGSPPREEPIVSQDEDDIAAHLERGDTRALMRQEQVAEFERYSQRPGLAQRRSEPAVPTSTNTPNSSRTIDGNAPAQIIAEAKGKGPAKQGWKGKLRRGFEMASMSSTS